MNLLDIVNRDPNPQPWMEVSKIPWDDLEFSARMLREHLTQDHDAASRRESIIDQQVDWIHEQILGGQKSRILDLGCGPGLYCTRLAHRGNHCTGIDFGPASIGYANETAKTESIDCEFILGDLRETEFGDDRDVILLLFGEFNTFSRDEILDILKRSHAALAPGGRAMFEVHTLESIRARGYATKSWSAMDRGLFSDQPYIRLDEGIWHEDSQTAVERHYVIDATSGDVALYGTTTQAYSPIEYEALLNEAGFSSIEWRNDWPGVADDRDFELVVAGH